ncbi:MAG: autotransporter-associated beta strand repeat-containing protein [Kiritimatiellae bacterium]|nr:autotransporter-associated beta strand repeat-containing protein [Kiritimatiellia bacterium]
MKRLAFMGLLASLHAMAADTVVSGDMQIEAGTMYEINVGSGDTVTYSGSISGKGGVKKTGAGTLVLSGANTFSGGIGLSGGKLVAGASGALGTGLVDCTGSSIEFNATDGVFPNDFKLGNSSATPPTFAQNTTLNGKITLLREHNFYQNSEKAVFNGAIDGNKNIIYQTAETATFNGALALANLYGGSRYVHTGVLELSNPDNRIGTILLMRTKVRCLAANVMKGAILTQRGKDQSSAAKLYLQGFNQTVKACSYDSSNGTVDKGGEITSDSPATLTITGAGADKTEFTYYSFSGPVSIDINADAAFTQRFGGRASTMTGDIKVTSGGFEITGASSFPNVGSVVVSENGKLNLNSTASYALQGVTSLVLSGTLTSSTQPFSDGNVDLVVSGEGASLSLPAESRLTLKSLTVAGVSLAGEFHAGDDSCPWLKSGELVVAKHETVDSWTGAASDSSIAEAGNWASGTVPDFTGFCTPTFSSADAVGFVSTVDRPVAFAGLNLLASSFTFAKNGETALLSVGAGGITGTSPAEDGETVNYVFETPIRVTDTHIWSLPQKTVSRFLGGTTAVVPFTKEGDGDMVVSGGNVWDARMDMNSGNFTLSGTVTTSTGVESGKTPTFYAKIGGVTTGAAVNYMYLSNAVVEKAFSVKMASSSSSYYFRAQPASTNIFKAFFQSANESNQKLYVAEGSEVRIEGGADFPWVFIQGGYGTVRFSGKPVTYYNNADTGYYVGGGGTAVFEVGTNTIRHLAVRDDGGRVDFMVDHVCGLGDYTSFYMTGGLRGRNGSVLDIHGTRQCLGMMKVRDKAVDGVYIGRSKIVGDMGSILLITNNVTTRSSLVDHVPFAGGISLKFDSPGTMMLTNAISSSCGRLEVERGTVTLAHDAAWTNVSEVAVSGDGRLVVDAQEGVRAQPVFGKEATLSFADNGVLDIADGISVRVKHLFVGGVKMPRGVYGYSRVSDENVRKHFASDSTGVVSVRGEGSFTVTIR